MAGTLHTQGLTVGRKLISYPVKRDRRLVSCVKTSEAPAIAKTDGELCFFFFCSINVCILLLLEYIY